MLEGEAGLSLVAASPRLLEFSSGVQAIPDEGFAMLDHPATTTLRGAYGLQPIDRLRLVLGVEHVLRLGARVTADLLIETTDDVPHLLRRLDNLRRLTPEVAAALGAGDWTAPLRPGRRPWSAA